MNDYFAAQTPLCPELNEAPQQSQALLLDPKSPPPVNKDSYPHISSALRNDYGVGKWLDKISELQPYNASVGEDTEVGNDNRGDNEDYNDEDNWDDNEEDNNEEYNNVDDNESSDSFQRRARGTLWACISSKEKGLRPQNKVVYDRTLVLLQGAMVSGILRRNDVVGYVRWWYEDPLGLSSRMGQVWKIVAQSIIKENRPSQLPDTQPEPLEARSVRPLTATNRQMQC
jgi:hypothetical protein